MKIVVLDGYTLNPGDNPWDQVAALGDLTVYDRTSEDQIVERAKDAEIVLTNKTPLSAETINALPKLKFISVLATGYNVVDIKAARQKDVPVSNIPIYGTDTVAQFVFAHILNFVQNVNLHGREVSKGRWADCPDFCFWDTPLTELKDKTLGVLGFGRIGKRTGGIGHAFGMDILASDVYREDPPSYHFSWVEVDELFRRSDFISLHCPLTPENTGMIDKKLLRTMKPNAFLVNTARGPLVNEQDLADALNEGVIAGAACDVVSVEPIKKDNPLLKAKNLTLTPHIAWATLEARTRLMGFTKDNIAAFQNGDPIHVVNKDC